MHPSEFWAPSRAKSENILLFQALVNVLQMNLPSGWHCGVLGLVTKSRLRLVFSTSLSVFRNSLQERMLVFEILFVVSHGIWFCVIICHFTLFRLRTLLWKLLRKHSWKAPCLETKKLLCYGEFSARPHTKRGVLTGKMYSSYWSLSFNFENV